MATPATFGRFPESPSRLGGFGIAVFTTALALVASHFVEPRLGIAGAYCPLLFAVFLSAWYGGVWPALLAQIGGGVAVFAFIARPLFAPIHSLDVYSLLLFLLVAKLLLLLTANLRWTAHLKRNREHLEMIARATHDSLWEWDLKTDEVWRAGNLQGIFGCVEQESINTIDWWRERLHPDDSDRVWANIRHVIDGGEVRWAEEYRVRRSNGTYIPVADHGFVMRDGANKPVRMVGGMADVSARRQAEERLLHSAYHDALTALPNRELFLDLLERAVTRTRSEGTDKLAVLFLDLDRFKVVNDSLGHAVGDQLLAAVAQRLTTCLAPDDTAARFGGDEFTVLLQQMGTVADAISAAERIQQGLAAPFEVSGSSIVVTASIGIALADIDKPEEALRHADIAMYRAKSLGKARYVVFEPSLDKRAMDVLQLETDLRQSLQNRTFQLCYQPIVCLETGQVVSFEALLRWNHPRRGVLRPAEFLPVAEEAGLTIPLGHWVIREACQRLQEWRQLRPELRRLCVNVNLSGREFMQPRLVDILHGILKDTELPGDLLTVELTESMIMENDEVAAQKLQYLRELGIRLAIDDFGRGYSSLVRLQEFPISILKVDGAFVSRISAGKSQIFDAIMALATELKLDVTAEGVEKPDQFDYLKKSGAAMGQGLFFSDVLTSAHVERLLRGQDPIPWAERMERSTTSERAAGIAAG